MSGLHTLTAPASLLQEIRKSRFLAHAAPVENPEQGLAFLADIGDPLATHNCWAYRIGHLYRFSDDGEPGGTAGRPILQAIEGQGFDQVIVVVTRWYGGTKLGAGGLARAYGGCAAECLRLAPRTPLVDMAEVQLDCEFALLPILHARFDEFSIRKLDESFDARGARLRLHLPRDRVAAFSVFVRDLSRGRALVESR
ncbi:MAG TPA: YigZ family protein [Dokdonella sp.]|uniref:IMPACT family protein n=1 Tax=Dokdonella sp. TaxID=2291710 RepID=UPI002C8B450A|nr:YigZ family protein [Dokdonella sp.]HOX71637.1 YigZ family protein [Dokdonella sp.]HPG93316.1 YigZ family protein [Dokdonella sp.]HPN80778.1 YigZ family protein [Dokdonella sp.]